MSRILQIADEIIDLETIGKGLEGAVAENKKLISAKEDELLAAMIDEGTGRFERGGTLWYPEHRTFISPVPAMKAAVEAWVAANGGEDLVKTTMHAGSRDAFLREHMLNDEGEAVIPSELSGAIKVFEQTKIKRRSVPK